MISAQIDLQDFSATALPSIRRLGATSFAYGASSFEVFDSIHISHAAKELNSGLSVWVGEYDDPFPDLGARESPNPYASFFEHEGLRLTAERTGAGTEIWIARTAAGSSPLYLAATEGLISASWRFEDAVSILPVRKPDLDACRLYLKEGPTLTRAQVIEGVAMLWPGERVRVSADGMWFEENRNTDVAQPMTAKTDARISEHFIELTFHEIERALARSAGPLVEVSGGMDSSCVALAAARSGRKLSSYGIIHGGPMGLQQRARRAQLVNLLGLDDFEVTATEFAPFQALSNPALSLTTHDDQMRLASIHGAAGHPSAEFDLVLTGLGGDELFMPNAHVRRTEPAELGGNVATSSIAAAAGRSDLYMRQGVWVRSPFVSQSIVDYCRAIPEKMKTERKINALALARAGLTDGFLYPRYPEHCGLVVLSEAIYFDFDGFMKDSMVADFRIADISPLLRSAAEAGLYGWNYELITRLYLLLKLEVVLRRYLA